jgi:alpha-ketoglutarate-dependent taurine dioxygenase
MHTEVNWPTLDTKAKHTGITERCLSENELSWKTALDNFPLVVEQIPNKQFTSIEELLHFNRTWILQQLTTYGAVLFRGFSVNSREQFENILVSLGLHPSPVYPLGISPRSRVSGNVFNSTYVHRLLIIPPHTEMAYLQVRPRWIAFYCEQQPKTHGETPCFDMHKAYQMLPDSLRSRLSKSRMKYRRRISSKKPLFGIGRTIEETFGNQEKDVIERACRKLKVRPQWLNDNLLQAETELPIIIIHPLTGKPCLNAQFSHPEGRLHIHRLFSDRYSFLNRWLLEFTIRKSKKSNLQDFYRTFLSDGWELQDKDVNTIYEIFHKNSTIFSWRRGDILLMDNIRSGHGRLNFTGKRSIMTCFGDFYDSESYAKIS